MSSYSQITQSESGIELEKLIDKNDTLSIIKHHQKFDSDFVFRIRFPNTALTYVQKNFYIEGQIRQRLYHQIWRSNLPQNVFLYLRESLHEILKKTDTVTVVGKSGYKWCGKENAVLGWSNVLTGVKHIPVKTLPVTCTNYQNNFHTCKIWSKDNNGISN